ncbi:EF-P lysine aminoacylase EpmA [Neorhodopirellula pilleata]|uniref:Elongation factor P--(R)-beta-lysine ligase n=1 Tax=Neorhodopirellula pilleata TaxID=2714738 RepID=A0A5C6A4C4_9BACT|nr:EF-P lysine aminoacylase EpmA [Neorhodopirellula pilleata]TWT94245.1 Elongation factor P--(R)-beta-lysine ligase [Neorhodopirellula pilleata]
MSSELASRLIQRDRLLRQIRCFFHERGFIEVQPPCLSRDCVVDAFLDPISIPRSEIGLAVGGGAEDFSSDRYFLQTSPESAMKRLLADGAPSVFAIVPVFRRAEIGVRHNVEFTMLEWYEVGGNAASAIELLGRLAQTVFETDRFETVSYLDAFVRVLDLDPVTCAVEQLGDRVAEIDAGLAESMAGDRDALLDVLISHHVEPTLGQTVPAILTRYPVTQAALARPCADDPRFAERFELFYRGMELANGYDELLDADELVRRFEINNATRRQNGRDPLPTQTTLVGAMRKGLPKCSGVAVGVDRLAMLQCGAAHIREVAPLTIDVA